MFDTKDYFDHCNRTGCSCLCYRSRSCRTGHYRTYYPGWDTDSSSRTHTDTCYRFRTLKTKDADIGIDLQSSYCCCCCCSDTPVRTDHTVQDRYRTGPCWSRTDLPCSNHTDPCRCRTGPCRCHTGPCSTRTDPCRIRSRSFHRSLYWDSFPRSTSPLDCSCSIRSRSCYWDMNFDHSSSTRVADACDACVHRPLYGGKCEREARRETNELTRRRDYQKNHDQFDHCHCDVRTTACVCRVSEC